MTMPDLQTLLTAAIVCVGLSVSCALMLRLSHGWMPISLSWPAAWGGASIASLLVLLFVTNELFETEARHGVLSFAEAFALAAGILLLASAGWFVAAGTRIRGSWIMAAILIVLVASLLAYSFSSADVPALFDQFTDAIPT